VEKTNSGRLFTATWLDNGLLLYIAQTEREFSKKEREFFHIKEINKMRLKLQIWHAAEVDRLHVERNMLVGVNFLVI
jgi:hypothetical protein